MSKRTKKVGITGWMGPRYGIRIRRRTQEVEKSRTASYGCPKCSTVTVRRMGSGLWHCSRCDRTFASDAYAFRPAPSIFRVEEETPGAGAGRPGAADRAQKSKGGGA